MAKITRPTAAEPPVGMTFPGRDPGRARAQETAQLLHLENDMLSMTWRTTGGHLTAARFCDKLTGALHPLADAECFLLVLADTPMPEPRTIKASDLQMVAAPAVKSISAQPDAVRLADRFAGRQVQARFRSADETLEVEWRAELRDGANYMRQFVTVKALREPFEVQELVLLDLTLPAAKVVGAVTGSPVVAETVFCACESPLARNQVTAVTRQHRVQTQVRCSLPFPGVAASGTPVTGSAVTGVVPRGQLRRGFLFYLERERAHPHRTLLHYNNGYEIGCEYWKRQWAKKPEEADAFRAGMDKAWQELIRVFQDELARKRKVTVDAFVHDYEWDDEKSPWQFHKGYPKGFAPACRAAEKSKSKIGVWFSPWGGYPDKPAKLEWGRKQGFETNPFGLALAGPRYFARFRAACVGMVRKFDVSYFKFDGFAPGNNQPGPGEYASEVDALLRLIGELRALKPSLFVNPSTGSWMSPFWLLWADTIWRQGSDSGVAGQGTPRQQWITYRDSQTYRNVVAGNPLYPIPALMLHGVFIHHWAFAGPNYYDPANPAKQNYDPADIVAEIRSFFATGTSLQELYIAPDLMTAALWDTLAESAKWARANADVLADSHWVGGDPADGKVYGWASWTPRKGILTLRNPGPTAASVALDIGQALELPAGAPETYTLTSPWKEDAGRQPVPLTAGKPQTIALKPFEVLAFDATPTPPPVK